MGIGRTEEQFIDESPKPPFIIQKVADPIVVAAKKLHQSDPRATLELSVTVLFIILTVIGEILSNLPWGFYLALAFWIVGYFRIIDYSEKLYKKLKKQKKK